MMKSLPFDPHILDYDKESFTTKIKAIESTSLPYEIQNKIVNLLSLTISERYVARQFGFALTNHNLPHFTFGKIDRFVDTFAQRIIGPDDILPLYRETPLYMNNPSVRVVLYIPLDTELDEYRSHLFVNHSQPDFFKTLSIDRYHGERGAGAVDNEYTYTVQVSACSWMQSSSQATFRDHLLSSKNVVFQRHHFMYDTDNPNVPFNATFCEYDIDARLRKNESTTTTQRTSAFFCD